MIRKAINQSSKSAHPPSGQTSPAPSAGTRPDHLGPGRGTYSDSQTFRAWVVVGCAVAAVACIFLAQFMGTHS